MPIYVCGNSSNNSEHKIDTSFFVQKKHVSEQITLNLTLKKILTGKINIDLKFYPILLKYKMLVVKIMLTIYSTILV